MVIMNLVNYISPLKVEFNMSKGTVSGSMQIKDLVLSLQKMVARICLFTTLKYRRVAVTLLLMMVNRLSLKLVRGKKAHAQIRLFHFKLMT